MNSLCSALKNDLRDGVSIVLVGHIDSGKSWFVKNELIPSLKSEGYKVRYIEERDNDFGDLSDIDIVIVDEVETFADREYLEKRHPEEDPYYTKGYIKAVRGWHTKLKNIQVPTVFVVTRNEEEEIDNLVGSMHITDWGTQVKAIKFIK